MKHILCVLIRGYQLFISPLIHAVGGPATGCRFEPTCSQYSIDAIRQHGAIIGCWLGFKRILRCNPWGGQGFDPVPTSMKNSSPD